MCYCCLLSQTISTMPQKTVCRNSQMSTSFLYFSKIISLDLFDVLTCLIVYFSNKSICASVDLIRARVQIYLKSKQIHMSTSKLKKIKRKRISKQNPALSKEKTSKSQTYDYKTIAPIHGRELSKSDKKKKCSDCHNILDFILQ